MGCPPPAIKVHFPGRKKKEQQALEDAASTVAF